MAAHCSPDVALAAGWPSAHLAVAPSKNDMGVPSAHVHDAAWLQSSPGVHWSPSQHEPGEAKVREGRQATHLRQSQRANYREVGAHWVFAI